MKSDENSGSNPGSDRGSGEMSRSVARCQHIADQLRDTHIQELAAEVLILGAAAQREGDQARRDILLSRARMIQRCVGSLLEAADHLAGLIE